MYVSDDQPSPETPFRTIKVRVSALVFCGDEVALLRRDRPNNTHLYTTIGGNVSAGEPLDAALARELEEELALAPGVGTEPELLWLMDVRVTRPGNTPSPRKLHLIYRLHVTEDDRRTLATHEFDELAEGGHEIGHVQWVDYRQADLPLFPPIGAALAQLPTPTARPSTVELPAVTDKEYTWI
ncbi:NUDIX hydrolase [Nonomuraea jiangxiensis]|uniref:ADP-ribose pyrophosphatase YjhB, NUDIX family n=1 Tax=Nonomuraea jiangxiensis TaxID=633440 RepID=A0A1G8QCX5_9ACTN|nr:NUDIX domain-containing protein [Nonomuraea jiangxiensis]SDJ02654.1 ADP-ribose pyrophosphatase YjhB, NUDIX family [Nonomuraea jiangxiensis]